MVKYSKYILLICPIVLSLLLVLNIYKYSTSTNKYERLIQETNNYELKINDNTSKKDELLKELSSLKEEKKDKIKEHERWIKWNKEIKEKIN